MISEASRSATASIASSRRRMRSVRQSFASSTADRTRLPWCFSSFASKRSNSVNASAVPPANPARIRSWYRRRTLRAPALMTTFPSVTCPSPPSATRRPRRTETMVVPWNCSMDAISGAGVHHIEATALISSPFVAARPNRIPAMTSRGKLLLGDNARDLGDAHHREQCHDHLPSPADHELLALGLLLLEDVQQPPGVHEVDALGRREIDRHRARPARVGGDVGEPPVALTSVLAHDVERLVAGLEHDRQRGLQRRGTRRRRFPGRRRHLVGHRIVDRRLLELVLHPEHLVEV